MKKIISIVILVVGVILLVLGYQAYNSAASGISEVVSGTPTNEAMWYLGLGGLAVIVGLVSLLKFKK